MYVLFRWYFFVFHIIESNLSDTKISKLDTKMIFTFQNSQSDASNSLHENRLFPNIQLHFFHFYIKNKAQGFYSSTIESTLTKIQIPLQHNSVALYPN